MSVATQAPETDVASSSAFSSITALQAAHLELLQRFETIEHNKTNPSRRDAMLARREVRSLQKRVAATGTIIDKPGDRELAQSILDFWSIREAYIIRLANQLRDGAEAARPGVRQRGFRGAPSLPEPISLQPFDESATPELDDRLCPFVGLSAFSEQDASRHIFFGREEAVNEMVALIANSRLVIVSGPSGSGKSSLVMAGLVPALRAGALPGSASWIFWPAVQPGPDPIATLLQAVRPAERDPKTWVAAHKQRLEQSPDSLVSIVAEASARATPSLLIVDQAEELVSMTSDPAVQNIFASALVALASAPGIDRVLLVVREDFAQRLLEIPALANLPETARLRYCVVPLTSAGLRTAIVGPAQSVGLNFEAGVVEDLVREVINEPAALPLLQFTLAQLWQNRQRNKITRAAFTAVGGPNQALGRTAERVYEKLGSFESQRAARAIFMALVVPSVGDEYVRRRVRREALHLLLDEARIDRVLAKFVDVGLIRLTPGIAPDDDRFEVMHEALLRNWPSLADWLTEVRNFDQRRLSILNIAQLWINSGRQEDHLAVGAALLEARQYAERDPVISEFVQASDRAEVERQRLGLRRLRRTRTAAGAFALLAAISVIFGLEIRSTNFQLHHSTVVSDATSDYLAKSFCFSQKSKDFYGCVRDAKIQSKSVAEAYLSDPTATQQIEGEGSSQPHARIKK